MASPISFKIQPTDPHQELMKLVNEAPQRHAEALLLAYDLLQTAHDKGMLDLLHGLIGGRDIIASELAAAAKMPETIKGIRNVIALSRILASFDPETLHKISKSMAEGAKAHSQEVKPPSWWQLLKRLTSEDSRRGLSFATTMLMALGRASRT